MTPSVNNFVFLRLVKTLTHPINLFFYTSTVTNQVKFFLTNIEHKPVAYIKKSKGYSTCRFHDHIQVVPKLNHNLIIKKEYDEN